MLTLGLCGGLDSVHEQAFDTPSNYTYDGAAVLLENGSVLAAFEEERLNRIKHSNKLPVQAIARCLCTRDVDLTDIDEHKLAHAVAAMAQSGFAESLVYVIDNAGGVFAGSHSRNGAVTLTPAMATAPTMSIQKLFHAVFPFLGLGLFDEYKAMALAPYGDPTVYASFIESLYELGPGHYLLHLDRIASLVGKVEPRQPGEDFTQAHKDLAASLQHAMEDIVLHVLANAKHVTGIERVCLAGGMAENSSTNGRIIYTELFREVFVHPAAYDAGCALGAALPAAQEIGTLPAARVQGVAWGSEVGKTAEISARLKCWSGFVTVEQHDHIELAAAQRLARGDVIGWAQGRAEFGSHALGHRTALADPQRPGATVCLARALRRSTPYRPFGLAVIEEEAEQLFDLRGGPDAFRFMAAAARARDRTRALLPAGVHVDGTARLQIVARETSPRYWALLCSFQDLTGMPALLSASLNTEFEPTAESIDDAIATFLTSELDGLVLGSCMMDRSAPTWRDRLGRLVSLPPYVQMMRTKRREQGDDLLGHEIRTSYDPPRRRAICAELGDALEGLGRAVPAAKLLNAYSQARQLELLDELKTLWAERLIVLVLDRVAESVI